MVFGRLGVLSAFLTEYFHLNKYNQLNNNGVHNTIVNQEASVV